MVDRICVVGFETKIVRDGKESSRNSFDAVKSECGVDTAMVSTRSSISSLQVKRCGTDRLGRGDTPSPFERKGCADESQTRISRGTAKPEMVEREQSDRAPSSSGLASLALQSQSRASSFKLPSSHDVPKIDEFQRPTNTMHIKTEDLSCQDSSHKPYQPLAVLRRSTPPNHALANDSRATATYSPSGPQLPISHIWISSTPHAPRSTRIGILLRASSSLRSTAAFLTRMAFMASDTRMDWYENGNRHFNAGLR